MKGRNKIKEPTVGAVGVNSGSAQMQTAVIGFRHGSSLEEFLHSENMVAHDRKKAEQGSGAHLHTWHRPTRPQCRKNTFKSL